MNREEHHSTENTARIKRVLSQVAGLLPAAHYAALGGLGVAAGVIPEAEAAIIHSPATNLTIPNTLDGLYINVVTGANSSTAGSVPGWDINPYSDGTNLNWFTNGGREGRGMMRYPGVTTGAAGSLDVGNQVNAAGSFNTSIDPVTFGAAAGNWHFNATNYFGFKFTGDDTFLHYGWGTMIVGATTATRMIGDIYYQSAADTGIAVGDTGQAAVPAPATSLLLAAGAAGLLAFRRRQVH